MDNIAINELNAVLKGEEMAVEAYERYIKDINDENVKKEFQNIQQDHRRHIGELAYRIQNLGGKPEYGTGASGIMASVMNSVQNIGEKDTLFYLKQAYEGEDKGIAMVEEIIKGDLDSESAELVNRILSQDHIHLKRMDALISDMESKH